MSLLRSDRAAYRQKTRAIHDYYFDETLRQVDSGAQLILWPEAAGICASEDETALIKRGHNWRARRAFTWRCRYIFRTLRVISLRRTS